MDNLGSQEVNRTERRETRVQDLHLDRVVATQPEIGPTPPDGGYGWLIVVSASIYNSTIPSLLTLYGLVILRANRDEDHDEEESRKIWDMDIALVPIIMVVIRLLLESWCRAVVKIFNMPRFMGLAGLCLTVAGVLLSSYSTDTYSNDHIVNIFSGIFAGTGWALTGQQTEVIITHYFRENLTIAQRLVRMAPSIGNFLAPLVIGYLCTVYSGDIIVMIYAAILMQNCLFLASYTRPVYIEKVIRTTYNMLRDAAEDEDEVIYSNQNQPNPAPAAQNPPQSAAQDDDNDVVVFKSRNNAREILDPAVQFRESSVATVNDQQHRFSSDFSSMFAETSSNRFSSNFGSMDIMNYAGSAGTHRYQELEDIDRDNQNPQPLYRETTVNAPQSNVVFATEPTAGTIRRTASLKKNLITIANMLMDVNFYLYALLHLCTTFSIVVLGVFLPAFVWVQVPQNIWWVATTIAMGHGAALCFIMLCLAMPKDINEKTRLCAFFCVVGALGFYGITLSGNRSLLILWCMFASISTASSSILLQPLYNSTLNEFDTTATITATNLIVATFILTWSLVRNYEYRTCFLTAAILQAVTAAMFLAFSFRRRR
ncbi:uncharacterized protein LOC135076051 [Ostrinia nubilalis]|uniref:uncharacterized protein LOC135076051 n=1 Tax=Ostrinia nubilalis TaxID=29057 RepID=UPI0030825CAD